MCMCVCVCVYTRQMSLYIPSTITDFYNNLPIVPDHRTLACTTGIARHKNYSCKVKTYRMAPIPLVSELIKVDRSNADSHRYGEYSWLPLVSDEEGFYCIYIFRYPLLAMLTDIQLRFSDRLPVLTGQILCHELSSNVSTTSENAAV